MIRKIFLPLSAVAITLALSSPVQAADYQEQTEEQARLDKFMQLFTVNEDDTPIAPDQLARGRQLAMQLLPDGSYRQIMAATFEDMLGPMMASFDQIPLALIAQFAGIPEDQFSPPDDATLNEIMLIVDPYYKDRQEAIFSRVAALGIELSDEIEPAIREGLARAYSRRFSAQELDDISAFLSTDTGSKFGAEILAAYSSKEVIDATLNLMPKFIDRFTTEFSDPEALMADLPPQRSVEDLSEEQLQRLNTLLGIDSGGE